MPSNYLTDWSDDYLIGIEKIDDQHKEFFRIAHQFFTECLADEGEECLQDTLNYLRDYARKHFEGEEAFMKEIEYPRLEEHSKLHTDFLNRYAELIVEFKKSGRTEKMVNKVLTVVMDWLKDHIVKADGAYAKHAKTHS
jgi:hemerythrin